MSFIQYLDLVSSLKWHQTDIVNDTLLFEDANLTISDRFTSGTGADQVNKAFYTNGELSSGQNLQFDLFSLNRTIFDKQITTDFSGDNLKLFYVENTSTGVGQDLFVCATGSGGISHSFGYGYLGWIIKPQSYSIFFDRNIGYAVNSTARYFYINDISGNSPSYQIALFGVTTTG